LLLKEHKDQMMKQLIEA